MKKLQLAIIAAALVIAAQANASISISSLNTGAGQYGVNYTPPGGFSDPNWTVSLDSSTGTPPGGNPTGTAYLVPNNIGFPFGYWIDNDSTSTWITYSSPTQTGGDTTADTFRYEMKFTAAGTGTDYVRWLSDNTSSLFLNNSLIGTRTDASNPDGAWNLPFALSLTSGTQYTVDVVVYNEPQGSGNPTGARVEFTGNVSAVPEPTTMIAGALLLLPFGASTIRILRRKNAA